MRRCVCVPHGGVSVYYEHIFDALNAFLFESTYARKSSVSIGPLFKRARISTKDNSIPRSMVTNES
jgi:hypothetical protein